MIEDIFFNRTKLPSALPGYHPRPTQIKAAGLIDNALYNYKNIVVEAPTGSGKTISYLAPVFSQGKRTIISTKTKQLMQQLYLKDIPVMVELFGERSVALLKGRKNYFCPHRFLRWIYPNTIYYQDVVDWYSSLPESPSEIPSGRFDRSINDKMSADSHQCIYAKCRYFHTCPFYEARKTANESGIVITNHYLLLTDIAMKAGDDFGSILDPADHIIFDEAHSLPDIYAAFAGVEISMRRLVSMVLDYNAEIPFDQAGKLMGMFEAMGDRLREGKVLYDSVRGHICEFMDLCRGLTASVSDTDLKDEFDRWDYSFSIVDGDADGLRTVEQRGRDVLIRFIPLHTGSEFLAGLGRAALSSVFISATLTTNGLFDYFLRETGLAESEITTALLPPVFDMSLQAKLLVPIIRANKKDEAMLKLIEGFRGSALVICNSLRRMEELVEFIGANQQKAVYSQNDGDWSTFTSNENIVLVGCASLREGIDLASGDFRCVIIDKLPFEYPHDLYLAYKAQRVAEEVGNPFMNFNLPRAVLYFKQAAGRLIRHESDKGVLAVFDDRILTRTYGVFFQEAIGQVPLITDLAQAISFLND